MASPAGFEPATRCLEGSRSQSDWATGTRYRGQSTHEAAGIGSYARPRGGGLPAVTKHFWGQSSSNGAARLAHRGHIRLRKTRGCRDLRHSTSGVMVYSSVLHLLIVGASAHTSFPKPDTIDELAAYRQPRSEVLRGLRPDLDEDADAVNFGDDELGRLVQRDIGKAELVAGMPVNRARGINAGASRWCNPRR